jgi:hypothetical protein
MDLADILGKMVEATKGPTLMIGNTGLVYMFGQMGVGMKETGLRASNTDRESICWWTAQSRLEFGSTEDANSGLLKHLCHKFELDKI